MLVPALPVFLLPATALLVFLLRLWSDAGAAAAADQLGQADRLFPRICHLSLLYFDLPPRASESGSVGVASQESCSSLVAYPDSHAHVMHPPTFISPDYIIASSHSPLRPPDYIQQLLPSIKSRPMGGLRFG